MQLAIAISYFLIAGTILAISTWIVGIRAKKRIKKALGTTVNSDFELTSFETWTQVEAAEDKSTKQGPG